MHNCEFEPRKTRATGSSLLYSAIKIDFRAESNGEVTVPRCFFSRHYTPEICRLVSALDEGLAEGFPAAAASSSTSGSPKAKTAAKESSP